MSVKLVQDIRVQCPKNHCVSIPKQDWEYEVVETEDRSEHGMGNGVHHQYSVDGYSCPECGAEIDAVVDIWEYPNGSIEVKDKSENVENNIDDSFIVELD